ncbi:flavodoxin family protein [Methanofollis fontis]|uniref:Flavodoxin family protein n=1 Tax=Methanofollis fontis TaxID=2052832 RepID=A0A483CT20_9EURY|nr:flavodoxin family protein [Methanofollis fontis]TAJ43804.1 flavodoxin family protein [Methanofollis fontis]
MAEGPDLIQEREVETAEGTYALRLSSEDLSFLYPGMHRYTLRLTLGDAVIGTFRTNTYEYSPTVPLNAADAARKKMDEWETALVTSRERFLPLLTRPAPLAAPIHTTDVVVIQGSPRPDGNCSIYASWVVDEGRRIGRSVQVIYIDDLAIRPCIGCYRCYNTGLCTFRDDMAGIIGAVRAASLLVICSPVYTGTVPGGLKTVLDRFQALHAGQNLFGGRPLPPALLCAVCGRSGMENFACLREVIRSCLGNLGIRGAGEIYADGMDRTGGIGEVEGLEERVRTAVRDFFARKGGSGPPLQRKTNH